VGSCGFAREAEAAEDAEEEADRASGSPGEGTWKGPGWGRKWAWRGNGGLDHGALRPRPQFSLRPTPRGATVL